MSDEIDAAAEMDADTDEEWVADTYDEWVAMLPVTAEAETEQAEPLRLSGRIAEALAVEPDTRSREFRAVLVAAGRIRNADGSPGRYVMTPTALAAAVDGGMFEALAAFVDHAGMLDGPSLRNLLGVWHSAAFDPVEQAVTATLRVYDTDANRPVVQLLDEIMATPAAARPDVGVSIVFYPVTSEAQGIAQVTGIRAVESADVVFKPAVERSRILAALQAQQATDAAADDVVDEQATGVSAVADEFGDINLQEMQTMSDETKIENGAPTESVEAAAWLGAIQRNAVQAIISGSGLPAVVQERLGKQQYASPAAVEAAVAEARAELAALTESNVVQLGGQPPRGRVEVGDPMDEAENIVNWMFGIQGLPTPAANMRRLSDLYVALTGDVEFRGVFDPTRIAFGAANTTTMTNLVVDAVNKVMAQQMSRMDHYRWYERIVSVEANDGTLNDMKWITLGGLSNLPVVSEGASYSELTPDDAKETAAFIKRGAYVGITREAIKNSNIQQLQAIPRALANAAIRTRSAAVSAIFTANAGVGPTLAQDSKALFHVDHKNLRTSALDATAWRAARAEAFKHGELQSGAALGVYPRFLLVPSELYDTALSILGYGEGMPTSFVPEAQDRGFADPRAIPLTVPDWTDATDWAYIVDPMVYPVIQMSYSQAPGGGQHPAPEVFSVMSETGGLLFTNDTMPIKVRDEFAVGVNGPRGIGKRNVAN